MWHIVHIYVAAFLLSKMATYFIIMCMGFTDGLLQWPTQVTTVVAGHGPTLVTTMVADISSTLVGILACRGSIP